MPRAEFVSIDMLAKSIDRAVAIAAKRHELAVERPTLLDKWEIVGRRLAKVHDLDAAFNFAQDVARSVKVPGIRPQPVVVKIGKQIICGFIERANIPRQLPR